MEEDKCDHHTAIESKVHIMWIKEKLEELDLGQKEILSEIKKVKDTDLKEIQDKQTQHNLADAAKFSKLNRFLAIYGLTLGAILTYLFGFHSLIHFPLP